MCTLDYYTAVQSNKDLTHATTFIHLNEVIPDGGGYKFYDSSYTKKKKVNI